MQKKQTHFFLCKLELYTCTGKKIFLICFFQNKIFFFTINLFKLTKKFFFFRNEEITKITYKVPSDNLHKNSRF